MISLHSPIRIMLALAIGLVPLLCCCGATTEKITATVQTTPQDEHACCESVDPEPAASTPIDTHSQDCGCEATIQVMQETRAGATVTPLLPAEMICLDCSCLPQLWSVILLEDTRTGISFPAHEAAGVTTAPTLLSLNVLLLT